MKAQLHNLTPAQQKQVRFQWEMQQHKTHTTDIDLSGHGNMLKGFIVREKVLNPALVASKFHASYLFYNNARYAGQRVLDMGTGTGLMGIVMALHGAHEVVMVDISPFAVENAKENVKKFGIEGKAKVVQSDLFQNVSGRFDTIVFNHPFFGDTPPAGDSIAASMIAPPKLLKQFLREARGRLLSERAGIIMPYFELAGEANDPRVVAPEFGYSVKTVFEAGSYTGLQKGVISIHELTL